MALFITTGGVFLHDNATVDLIAIANMDTGYGETDVSSTKTQVTYARTLAGAPQLRLDDLVNNGSYTSPPDIVIFAVDGSFILADGTPITSAGGVTTPVGNVDNPTTADVAVIYDTSDCNGSHYWVDKEGGGTTSIPTPVMLYHELSHAFHFVTGTTASTSAQEEVNAETDENVMRDQMGVPHRDVTSHNGGCGGSDSGSCCIIASISTGTPYSDEVRQLRSLRDKILRRSEVGSDYFRVFFYDYYSFSPEVCTLMGNNDELRDFVKTFFVVPVIHALELVAHYKAAKGQDLVPFIEAQFEKSGLGHQYDLNTLRQIEIGLTVIKALGDRPLPYEDLLNGLSGIKGIEQLFGSVGRGVALSAVLKWALMDPLAIWIDACIKVHADGDKEQLEISLRESISHWMSELPVTSIWEEFSRIQTEIELANLDEYIFDNKGKLHFADRLANIYPAHRETINHWSRN